MVLDADQARLQKSSEGLCAAEITRLIAGVVESNPRASQMKTGTWESTEEPFMGKPKDITPNVIRHDFAPQQFREQIDAVHRLIGRYLGLTLEEFKIGFMRDSRSGDEVAIWCRIATVWYDYHDHFLGGVRLPDDQEEKLVAALIAIVAGEKDIHSLPVAAAVGARLLACYEGR